MFYLRRGLCFDRAHAMASYIAILPRWSPRLPALPPSNITCLAQKTCLSAAQWLHSRPWLLFCVNTHGPACAALWPRLPNAYITASARNWCHLCRTWRKDADTAKYACTVCSILAYSAVTIACQHCHNRVYLHAAAWPSTCTVSSVVALNCAKMTTASALSYQGIGGDYRKCRHHITIRVALIAIRPSLCCRSCHAFSLDSDELSG
jgi:hypothetical protein